MARSFSFVSSGVTGRSCRHRRCSLVQIALGHRDQNHAIRLFGSLIAYPTTKQVRAYSVTSHSRKSTGTMVGALNPDHKYTEPTDHVADSSLRVSQYQGPALRVDSQELKTLKIQARTCGDVLVVGLIPDEEIIKVKGPPVCNNEERYADSHRGSV
eukprot:676038-Prorocentrum_minimum.AAC.3